MGYTHYWRHEKIEQETFDKIVNDFEKVIPAIGVKLGNGYGEGEPIMDQEIIVFNGDSSVDMDHESFVLECGSPSSFNFCKTACKPYDIAVTACLVIAKNHLGDDIRVSSDGELKDWKSAIGLCQEVLGYGDNFKLGD